MIAARRPVSILCLAMAETYQVHLHRKAEPIFPLQCARCGNEDPDSTLRMRAAANSWWFWVFPWAWLLWPRRAFDIGVCHGCKGRLASRTRITLWSRYLVCAIAISLVILYFGSLSGHRGAIWLVVIGLMIIWAIFHTAWPPAIEISSDSRKLEFEFVHWDYADAFRELNEGEVKKHTVPRFPPD